MYALLCAVLITTLQAVTLNEHRRPNLCALLLLSVLFKRLLSLCDNIKMNLQEVGCVGVWTGLIWLRIGTGDGHL